MLKSNAIRLCGHFYDVCSSPVVTGNAEVDLLLRNFSIKYPAVVKENLGRGGQLNSPTACGEFVSYKNLMTTGKNSNIRNLKRHVAGGPLQAACEEALAEIERKYEKFEFATESLPEEIRMVKPYDVGTLIYSVAKGDGGKYEVRKDSITLVSAAWAENGTYEPCYHLESQPGFNVCDIQHRQIHTARELDTELTISLEVAENIASFKNVATDARKARIEAYYGALGVPVPVATLK